jgi:hypothetical protein
VQIELWRPDEAGVLALPSGRLVRGRGLRYPMPSGHPPTFRVYLLGAEPPELRCRPTAPPTTQDRTEGGPWRWIRWPDFWLPADPAYAREVLLEAWRRSESERVEIACGGGRGRTGTALACLAVLDGVPAGEAVRYVREHYHPHAVETPWQKRFVRRFVAAVPTAGTKHGH